MGRACGEYKQCVLREAKSRSCFKCKAVKNAALGCASPSLKESSGKVTEGKEVVGANDAAGIGTLVARERIYTNEQNQQKWRLL